MGSIMTKITSDSTVSKSNSIIKTPSMQNLYLTVHTEPGSHYKLTNKLLNMSSKHPDYRFINEIIENSCKPTKNCSNPYCRNKLDMKGTIYNAFDVQFCCEECRNLSSKHVIKYWI